MLRRRAQRRRTRPRRGGVLCSTSPAAEVEKGGRRGLVGHRENGGPRPTDVSASVPRRAAPRALAPCVCVETTAIWSLRAPARCLCGRAP